MSTYNPLKNKTEQITPPGSFLNAPLSPPLTEETKPFTQVRRVLDLFRNIKAGRSDTRIPWRTYQLGAHEELEALERDLKKDSSLEAFVKNKIRYDFDARTNTFFVRMPSQRHEVFIDRVENAVRTWLRQIGEQEDKAANFAQQVGAQRSSPIQLPDENSNTLSTRYPDAHFKHECAKWSGVVIEVAYSQKKKHLGKLADDYLMDSDGNIQVVVGLDIEYGTEGRSAALSVWRTNLATKEDGDELATVQVVEDKVYNNIFRDWDGNPVDSPGLHLHLSDFANRSLAQSEIGDQNQELFISGNQLCAYLTETDRSLTQPSPSEDKYAGPKRKRSDTPPEEIATDDEAKIKTEEDRLSKRQAQEDLDFRDE